MHPCECKKKVFEIVFGEDSNWTIRGEPPIKQPLPDSAHGIENLRVRELPPLSSSVSLGYTDSIWKTRRPLAYAVGKNCGIRAKIFVRLDEDRAVSQAPHQSSRSPQADRSNRPGRSRCRPTPNRIGSAMIAVMRPAQHRD